MDPNELLLEEWKDIRETLRYFGNKRFTQLTVFLTANAFMFNEFSKQADSTTRWIFTSVGCFGALMFGLIEHSSVTYWTSFAERGREIETNTADPVPMRLMTNFRSPEPWYGGTYATYAVYFAVAALWLGTMLFFPGSQRWDTVKTAEHVLNTMPAISGNKASVWTLQTLGWNEPSKTYKLMVIEKKSSGPEAASPALPNIYVVSFDTLKERIVNVEKKAE